MHHHNTRHQAQNRKIPAHGQAETGGVLTRTHAECRRLTPGWAEPVAKTTGDVAPNLICPLVQRCGTHGFIWLNTFAAVTQTQHLAAGAATERIDRSGSDHEGWLYASGDGIPLVTKGSQGPEKAEQSRNPRPKIIRVQDRSQAVECQLQPS